MCVRRPNASAAATTLLTILLLLGRIKIATAHSSASWGSSQSLPWQACTVVGGLLALISVVMAVLLAKKAKRSVSSADLESADDVTEDEILSEAGALSDDVSTSGQSPVSSCMSTGLSLSPTSTGYSSDVAVVAAPPRARDHTFEVVEGVPFNVTRHRRTLCSICGMEGHRRQTCPDAAEWSGVGLRYIAVRLPDAYTAHQFTSQTYEIPELPTGSAGPNICPYCGARFFDNERSQSDAWPCCLNGTVVLDPGLDMLSDTMSRLLLDPRGIDGAPRAPENDNRFFRRHIRLFNNAFAFSSIQAKRHPAASSPNAPPVHVLQGSIYSFVGTMAANSGREPAFLQLWLDGRGNEIRQQDILRVLHRTSTPPSDGLQAQVLCIVHQLYGELGENQLAATFRRVYDDPQICATIRSSSTDTLRLEVIDGSGTATAPSQHCSMDCIWLTGSPYESQDLVVRRRAPEPDSPGLSIVSEGNPFYDSLAFPLLFPRGEPGYRAGIPASNRDRPITRREFYCFLTHVRNDPASIRRRIPNAVRGAPRDVGPESGFHGRMRDKFLLAGGLASFNMVVQYLKVENERLRWMALNQSSLFSMQRNDLERVLQQPNVTESQLQDESAIFKLPASFVFSPRYMRQCYLDSMALVRAFGLPSLFLTMTCSPEWPEIAASIPATQDPADRFDMLDRSFALRLRKLKELIWSKQIFGKCLAYTYSIEAQKRGECNYNHWESGNVISSSPFGCY